MSNWPVRSILFVSSYSPLLLILAVKDGFDTTPWWYLFVGAAVASVAVLAVFMLLASNVEPHFEEMKKVKPGGGEAIGYIVTYLIPFLDVKLSGDSELAALLLLLLVIGVVYVNSNLIYINPLLNVRGYRLFEVENNNGKPQWLLTKNDFIPVDTPLSVISLGDYVLMEKMEKR